LASQIQILLTEQLCDVFYHLSSILPMFCFYHSSHIAPVQETRVTFVVSSPVCGSGIQGP